MEKIYNEIIDEELFYEKMKNGLEVYYIPKKGFLNKYAVLGVDFGSNDLEFIPIGEDKKIRVSDGIAHFLEHKMFEQPDESNAFDKFAEYGASANAFTNFTMTAYLFSATENFYPSLKHLIEYVQTPHYTDENVNKEKGIIAQEIRMYEDDPGWGVYFNCLRAMYKNHHTNIDIAGTVESIQDITPEELYKCYNTFYNPANMKLFIVGDLEEEELFEFVKETNNDEIDSLPNIQRFMEEEPKEVNEKCISFEATVSSPMFYLGYKDEYKKLDPKEDLKKEVLSDIIFDIVFSESGELYSRLYNEGLVIGPLSGGYMSQKDYAYAICAGVSKDPKKLKEIVGEYIAQKRAEGIGKCEFEMNKKKKIGGFLKAFDSIEYLANNFLKYMFKGINFLDYLEVLRGATLEDINARFAEFYLEEQSAISIVEPKKEN